MTKEKFDQILEEVMAKARAEKWTEPTITIYTSKENIDTMQEALKEFYSHIKNGKLPKAN